MRLTEHHSPRAVVCIKEGHSDLATRLQFQVCWGIEGKRLLHRISLMCISGPKLASHQNSVEVLIGLLARFEDALCIVQPTGVPLQAQKDLARGSRAVHTDGYQRHISARVDASTHNGDLRLSRPARWSL